MCGNYSRAETIWGNTVFQILYKKSHFGNIGIQKTINYKCIRKQTKEQNPTFLYLVLVSKTEVIKNSEHWSESLSWHIWAWSLIRFWDQTPARDSTTVITLNYDGSIILLLLIARLAIGSLLCQCHHQARWIIFKSGGDKHMRRV